MMILRATEKAIQGLLQSAIDDSTGYQGAVPVLIGDDDENKPQMPYVTIQCTEAEEQITPGCGIFKVGGEIHFRSHTKVMTPESRQEVLDAINYFAYNSTRLKLSEIPNFHCHGWHPTTGVLTAENDSKSFLYVMKYWVYCMAMNDS